MKSPLTIPHFLTPPSTEVSHFIASDTQLVECLGCNPSYKLGELWKDTGYLLYGSQIHSGKTIGGLYHFTQSTVTEKLLTTLNNVADTATELWYNNGAGWTQITTSAWSSVVGMRTEMETMLAHCFIVGYNGSDFLPVGSLTGTTFSTSTNVVAMPQGKYIKRYRDRLYVANSRIVITTTISNLLSASVPAGYSYLPVASNASFPENGVIAFGSNTGVTYTSKSPVSTAADVLVATAAAMPANTYANGTNGVGATLTANAAAVLTVDGVIINVGDRVLVKDEATGQNNGIYVCTTAGTAAVASVLTRTTDADQSPEVLGSVVYVKQGTTNRNTYFRNQNNGAITFSSTSITYSSALTTDALYGIPTTGTGSITVAGSVSATVTFGSSTPTPNRVYYSDVPVAGTLSWDPTNNFFDIDASEDITGISANWDRLMIFTDRNAYMYDGNQLKKVFQTGCLNQRTIKNLEAYMIWMNEENVYVSVSGGRPQPIGNDILQLIRNSAEILTIPDISKLSAEVVNNEYNLYLGATSANGISYSKCLATFNFDRGMWRWRELADEPTSMAWSTIVAGQNFMFFGNANGQVFRKGLPNSTIYSDNGTAIRSRFRTKAFDMGSPEILKAVTRIIAYAHKGGGLELRFRVFDKFTEKEMPFTTLGPLTKAVNILDKRLDGHFIQFEGIQMGTTEGWVFNGLTMLATASSHQS